MPSNSELQNTTTLSRPTSPHAISSRVIGALVLVFVEIMFFSALLSSYFVIKKGREIWNTAGMVHLPVGAAGFNTLVLFGSGFFLFLAGKAFRTQNEFTLARAHLWRSIALGSCFLIFQTYLGLRLISAGLTLHSSVFGGCFFLILGAHALQVVFGALAMIKIASNLKLFSKLSTEANRISLADQFNGIQLFWLFVVGIWPVLYAEIFF